MLTFANFGVNGASLNVGTIPAGAGLLRCGTVVGVAFNYGTTNNLSVGSAAGGAQIVASAAIGAIGINTQTIIAAQAGPLAADTVIWVTSILAGTAGSAGNALFVLEWANPTAG